MRSLNDAELAQIGGSIGLILLVMLGVYVMVSG